MKLATMLFLIFISSTAYAEDKWSWCGVDSTPPSIEIDDARYKEIYSHLSEGLSEYIDGNCKTLIYGIAAQSVFLIDDVIYRYWGSRITNKALTEIVLSMGVQAEDLAKFKLGNIGDLVTTIIDITADITIDWASKNVKVALFNHEEKPVEWLLKMAYLDAKIIIQMSLLSKDPLDKVGYVSDYVVSSSELLFDIGKENLNAFLEANDAWSDAGYAKKREEIYDLHYTYSKEYNKSSDATGRADAITEFTSKCSQTSLTDVSPILYGSYSSWVESQCKDYREAIVQIWINKIRHASFLAIKQDEETFDRYVTMYFPDEKSDLLKQYYNYTGNNQKFSDVTENMHAFKYLNIAAFYGIKISGYTDTMEFGVNSPISNIEALKLIHKAFFTNDESDFVANDKLSKYYYDLVAKKGASFFDNTDISESTLGVCGRTDTASNKNCLNRGDLAAILSRALNHTYDDENADENELGYNSYSGGLAHLEIVSGVRLEENDPRRSNYTRATTEYQPDREVYRWEFLKMLVKSLNWKLCFNSGTYLCEFNQQ